MFNCSLTLFLREYEKSESFSHNVSMVVPIQYDNLLTIAKWQSRLIFGDVKGKPYQSCKAGGREDICMNATQVRRQ